LSSLPSPRSLPSSFPFITDAKRASLVQSRIKAIERLADVEQFEDEPEIKFHFPDPPDMPSAPIISFKDVSFQYPSQPRLMFRKLNFGIDLDSRLSVVGPNGAGKTTLLKLISGDLEETGGIIERNPKIRIAIFSQHFVDSLDLALTALGLMSKSFPRVKEPELRAHLSNFGITQDLAAQPLYTLSGGQKSRVALAKLTWTKPHILLLDEPSNHLDMQSIDALAAGLLRFKGGVLMVSHDQHLIESSVEEMWGVEDDGSIAVFHGTFEDYIVKLMKK
jgi:ATP-binding cassette, subfamily F, member 3